MRTELILNVPDDWEIGRMHPVEIRSDPFDAVKHHQHFSTSNIHSFKSLKHTYTHRTKRYFAKLSEELSSCQSDWFEMLYIGSIYVLRIVKHIRDLKYFAVFICESHSWSLRSKVTRHLETSFFFFFSKINVIYFCSIIFFYFYFEKILWS